MTHISNEKPLHDPEERTGEELLASVCTHVYYASRRPKWLDALQQIRDVEKCACELRSANRRVFVIATSAPLSEKVQRKFGLRPKAE